MAQWKQFLVRGHIWSCVELFSEIEHKMALVSIIITMDTRPPEKLVMPCSDKNAIHLSLRLCVKSF